MSIRQTLKNLFAWSDGRRAGQVRCPTPRFRPQLEPLDARIVPAVRTWNPQGGSTDWFTAANWSENVRPTIDDQIVVPAGTGNLDLGLGTIDSLTLQDNYTNTVTLSYGDTVSINTLDVVDGTLTKTYTGAGHTIQINTAAYLGHVTGSTRDGLAILGSLTWLQMLNGSYAGVYNARFDDYAYLHVDSGASAILSNVQFTTATTSPGVKNYGTVTLTQVVSGDWYDGANFSTETYSRYTPIFNYSTGLLKVDSSSYYPVECFIASFGGTVRVAAGKQLHVLGKGVPFFDRSLTVDGGTFELYATGTFTGAHSVLITDNATLRVIRPSGNNGDISATLNAPVYILNAKVRFGADTQNDAGLNISSSGAWNFGQGSTLYIFADWNNVLCNTITCASWTFDTGNATINLATAGTPNTPYTIISSGSKTGDWTHKVGFGTINNFWDGGSFYVGPVGEGEEG